MSSFPLQIACVLLSLLYGASAVQAAEKPNIIFIFADDLGWGDLSCYGLQRLKTPGLDRMAKEGTLFTQFYVSASVCSPSRTAIMTGQYPARHRIFGHLALHEKNVARGMPDALDPKLVTLPKLLKSAGYRTGHFGKWHLGDIEPSQYGIDSYRTEQFSNVDGQEPLDIWSAANRPNCTSDIIDAALQYIDSNMSESAPLYVNAWLSDPHGTLNPSEEQLARAKRFASKNANFPGVAQVYYACVLEMDLQINRLLDALDERGLSDNTLVIFSSDNGPEDYQIRGAAHSGVGSAGQLRGRKRSIYEGGVRTPLILRWPGHVPAGKINKPSVVNAVDFLPTLCELTGVTAPRSLILDGESMLDAWLGGDTPREREMYWEWRYNITGHPWHHSPRLAVRDGDFKLLMNPDGSRIELYNLSDDPGERDNVANEHPGVVSTLRDKLLSWSASIPTSPADDDAGKVRWVWP